MKRCFRPSPFVLGPSPAIHSFFGTGGPLKRSKATVPFLSLFSLAEKRLGALKRGEKERERTRRKRGEILANLVHDSGELRTAFSSLSPFYLVLFSVLRVGRGDFSES